ncbi:MAG: mercury methylation corrinoid protein HgcA [Smithellaceae bacterium]|nr:mercury methylation corrinoid protein HgcA [Smithellaceae bacterium]
MNCCENKPDPATLVQLPLAGQTSCGCEAAEEPTVPPRLEQSFVTGSVSTAVGVVPGVTGILTPRDHWGSIKARWGVGRMNYAVDPGLYALGHPDDKSPVFVSANYKMSFDILRGALAGKDAWIMVLDTKGINVWCAAGKGTFGTEELARRIGTSRLAEIVSHRDLILPQLAGPGVAAHLVRKLTGFKCHFGPIEARDIPAYLDTGLRATERMRRKTFTLKERTVLIPIELVAATKKLLPVLPVAIVIGGVGGPKGFFENAITYGGFAALSLLAAVLAGTVLVPLLLPYLPGRAFSWKGASIGTAMALLVLYLWGPNLSNWAGRTEVIAWLLIIPALAAYLAMNFTGCSTYTSLSGVRREMRFALPLQVAAGASGFMTWVLSRLIA